MCPAGVIRPSRSESAVRFLVFGSIPLAERALDLLQIRDVDRLDSAHSNAPIRLDFPSDQITGFTVQCRADFLGNRRPAFGGDLGDCGHDKDSMRIISLSYYHRNRTYVTPSIASATLVTASLAVST